MESSTLHVDEDDVAMDMDGWDLVTRARAKGGI
jgi:hypothetical protein